MRMEWININDRLPEKATNVLLTKEVHYNSGRRENKVIVAWCGGEDNLWYDVEEDVIVPHPIAWMPFPAPYVEEEKISKEQALEILCNDINVAYFSHTERKAYDMAIDALKEKPIIEIDGKQYVAENPKLKTVHKLGEVVLGGFREVGNGTA